MTQAEMAEAIKNKVETGFLITYGRLPTQQEADTLACMFLIGLAMGVHTNDLHDDQRNNVIGLLNTFAGAEREACAKVAVESLQRWAGSEFAEVGFDIVSAIRARGKTPSLFSSAPVADSAENKPSSEEEMDKSAQIVRELIVSEIAPVLDHLPSPHPTLPKETFLMDGNEHTKGPDCHCSPTICHNDGCGGYLHSEPVYGPSFIYVCEKCGIEE